VAEAITAGGGSVVGVEDAEALVWTDPFAAGALSALLAEAPGIRWVQLPFAGVDAFLGVLDRERVWTSTKGAYSEPVAEHALALSLAGLRQLKLRSLARSWGRPAGTRLTGSRVTCLGGGGITRAFIRLLAPFDADVTVVKRTVSEVPGASSVVGVDSLAAALDGALVVLLALSLTPETAGIIDKEALACMGPDTWLVNVARGPHVVTDDLVAALSARAIGGAALDVTDPEPLPDGHPLWGFDNCLITPHVSNTWAMAEPLFAGRIRENVERYVRGEPLVGVVDVDFGY
jgi:phosphoglycerate dehydrogenase-like enzyme